MPLVKIEDRHMVKEIHGEQIGHESTRKPRIPRWVEITVYRLDDGSGWTIHRVGQSLVYHVSDTACHTARGDQSGEPALLADLPSDAHSCNECMPPYPTELYDDERIRFEFPRHSFDTFRTPAEATEFLMTVRDRETGRPSTVLTEPVAALLRQCRENDPDWASAPKPVESIGGGRRRTRRTA
jgi:hypothetical protein